MYSVRTNIFSDACDTGYRIKIRVLHGFWQQNAQHKNYAAVTCYLKNPARLSSIHVKVTNSTCTDSILVYFYYVVKTSIISTLIQTTYLPLYTFL